MVNEGPSYFPFVVDYEYKLDHMWEAMDWCRDNFGKTGTTLGPNSQWAIDLSAQWACINYKFCFNDPVAATHFKLRWG
jgi:hypothetical protein